MPFTNPKGTLIRAGLREGNVIADFGSGSGAYSIEAGKLAGNSGKVYSIDIQKDLLSHVNNNAREAGLSNVETIWGDVEVEGGTSLREDMIDCVIISNLLFQTEDKEELLKEARRILKPGGKLLLVDWKESFGNMGPTKEMVIDEHSARNLFINNGFTERETFNAGDHHYGIIFEKSK